MAKISVKELRCKGCGLCVNACPLKIVELDTDIINAKGYHPARLVAPEKCIGCKACAIMCPDCAIIVEK